MFGCFARRCGSTQKTLRVGGWDKTHPCKVNIPVMLQNISSPSLRNPAASKGEDRSS
ncbi:hypothetical protein PRBEI_2001182400 [Prionailurus iriomotensis]